VRAHRPYPLDVLAQGGPPHLHLDGPEAAAQVLVGLPEQRVERELQVDPARVAGHARAEAAEQPPERRSLPPRPQVPQRDVHRRDREGLGAAPPAVVERPPHRLPERLDVLGLAADEPRGQIAREQRVHRGAAGTHGVRVAHALRAVGVAQADGHQLEALDDPVGGVGERHRQRDAVVVGRELADLHGLTSMS
jgi:hypothetical protein